MGEQEQEEEGQQEEGQQEEGQQEDQVSNEPVTRSTCMCTDDLLGKWHLCILVTVPLRLCCDPKYMVRIRSVTCIFQSFCFEFAAKPVAENFGLVRCGC